MKKNGIKHKESVGWLGTLQELYDYKDDFGRGRLCMLLTLLLTGIAGQFHGGVFYTRFLLENGIDQTGVGILTFLPYIGCLFSIFSPYIIEHFPRRKWILFLSGLITNSISIMGITILPMVVKDANQRLMGFVIITVIANILTNLFSAGTGAWDAVFLPEKVRPDYLTSSATLNNMTCWICALAVSVVADVLAGTQYEMPLIIGIRCVGWILTVASSCLLLFKKEFPYTQTEQIRLTNVFRLPIRHKLFLGTMILSFIYYFVKSLPNATLNVWLLEDVGISYTLINGVNALYFIFCLLFSNMWVKYIRKHGWFITLAIGLFLESITFFAHAFVTADCIWLYVVVRLVQHFAGVPANAVAAAFVYINLPEEDKSYYITFAGLTMNLGVFLAMLAGTALTEIMSGSSLMLLGTAFVSTQILLLACGVGEILIAIGSVAVSKKLSPRKLPGV